MPTVFPGATDPTHHISLSDGTNTYGFVFYGGPRSLQEIPLSPPAARFAVEQRNWIGGRGIVRYSDDPTGFYDSSALWSTSSNRVFPAPQWRFASRADADEELPANNTAGAWWGLYGDSAASKTTRWLSRYFSAGSSTAADKAYVYVRRRGTPGTLTLELCANNAGVPGTVLKTVTKTVSDITDTTSRLVVFDWSGTQARSAATAYHLKVYGASTDSVTNHWEVFVNTAGSASGYSTNGTSWPAANVSLYYRVTGTDTSRQWKFFELDTCLYAVSQNDDKTSSSLVMNGIRGTVSYSSSSVLTCTALSMGTNDYAGAYIRIFDGTGDGQVRLISSNNGTQFAVTPNFDVTPDATSKFVVYATNKWPSATGTPGLSYVTGKPAVMNGIAYFPQGQSVKVRRMRVNGASHDYAAEATVTTDLLYVNVDPKNGTKIYGANVGSAQVGSADPQLWGTDLTIAGGYRVGAADYRITNLYNYAGALNIMKEDGRYIHDGQRVTRKGANFADVPSRDNGAAIGADDKYMWWSWGHSVVRTMGDQDTDMLNWRLGYEGLANDRRGVITCIVSAIGWMFFAVDGGTSNYSSILMWNGYGWHEIFRGWAAGVRIRNLYWQSCFGTRPRLWFDVNGELAYMEFPEYAANPLKDTGLNYHHEAVLITSTIDGGSDLFYKVLKGVKMYLETAQTVEVDYQKNEYCGTNTWTSFGSGATSPISEIVSELGEVYQIRFRFRLQTPNSLSPCIMNGWQTEGRQIQPKKYQYICTFVASSAEPQDLEGNPDTSADTLYSWLQSCAVNQTKLTMRTLTSSSDNKIVTVSLPSKTMDYVNDEGWGGVMSVAILEV